MNESVESKQNEAVLGLFKIGARMDVGIPGWLIDEVDHYRPIESSSEVTSVADGENNLSAILNSCYADKGYVFSWGFLSETRSEDYEEDDRSFAVENCFVNFEFCLKDLLIAFPNCAMLEDLINWMYANHPLANAKFDADESMGEWTMLMFTAHGTKEIKRMRRWLAQVFIPVVLPDLLREGMKIVEAVKAEAVQNGRDGTFNDVLVEHQRFQLCGDPKDLSF